MHFRYSSVRFAISVDFIFRRFISLLEVRISYFVKVDTATATHLTFSNDYKKPSISQHKHLVNKKSLTFRINKLFSINFKLVQISIEMSDVLKNLRERSAKRKKLLAQTVN